MQAKLGGLVGQNSGWVESLPLKVQGRVEALSTIQNDYDELEEKFQVRLLAVPRHPPGIGRSRAGGRQAGIGCCCWSCGG